MNISHILGSACLASLAVSVLLLVGCEDGDGTTSLTVTPSDVNLVGSSNSVTLVVDEDSLQELSLPLEWSVTNPEMGDAVGSGGLSAVYSARDTKGVNIVTVRDQFDSEGLVHISQD